MARERVCKRNPECSYQVSSMVHSGFRSPRTECPICGSDLVDPADVPEIVRGERLELADRPYISTPDDPEHSIVIDR